MEVNNTISQKLIYPEPQKHSSQVYCRFVLHPVSQALDIADKFENM